MGYPPAEILSETPVRMASSTNAEHGVTLVLHDPAWQEHRTADPECWVLYDVTLDAAKAPLPFGLDPWSETPVSAKTKLSVDTAMGRPVDFRRGNYRVTHFLPDNRVVIVGFKPNLVGIETVSLKRINEMPDFRS